ncbi:SafA/ExsA family spore coat assembly protein [Halalkalibacter lacteus]|uniref:SafA/ExsA family spore coat assembly protein n=1 Tax=Halalkalibacter lacteus TaxID=3090663 RepID=UPI002FCBBC04
MKIHIVQKGDTLWKLAQKYGVNFEQLKAANTQLSNPDMIMPGMKIKIPTGSVPVKKESQVAPQAAPMKEQPVQQKEVQTPPPMQMPEMPKMPVMPQKMAPPTKKQKTHVDYNTFETNINFYQPQQVKPKKEMPTVQKPPVSKPKKEAVKPKEEVKPEVTPKHYAPKPPVKPSIQPQMKPPMQPPMYQPKQHAPCPPEYMQPISPLMPGCQSGCGPKYPQSMPYGGHMQPMQQQPFQSAQSQMPFYPQHTMQPQLQQVQSQMPYYPQQQPSMPPMPQQQMPQQQMPKQQPIPGMINDCCGPGQPIMYGPNGQMMPFQQFQQQNQFMNGYHESDDYDD